MWGSTRLFAVAVTVFLSVSFAEAGTIRVGYLTGPAGSAAEDIGQAMEGLIDAAATNVVLSKTSTTSLTAGFFSSIDVLVFANGRGGSTVSLSAAERTNLLNFVTGGGTAYLGLDVIGNGAAIAADYGFTLADRVALTLIGTVTSLTDPIATGPFQPASSFGQSFMGRFNGAAPAGGEFLGSTSHGNALAHLDLGLGEIYIYSDEVPLFPNSRDHNNLFRNVLIGAGGMVAPEPASLALLVTGVGLFVRRRRSRRRS